MSNWSREEGRERKGNPTDDERGASDSWVASGGELLDGGEEEVKLRTREYFRRPPHV